MPPNNPFNIMFPSNNNANVVELTATVIIKLANIPYSFLVVIIAASNNPFYRLGNPSDLHSYGCTLYKSRFALILSATYLYRPLIS